MALLSLQEVSIRFGGPWLLEGATLNIERGERVCLLGRNGEGKSTLLPARGPVDATVQDILGGLRSACTYVGARKLKDLSKCTTFVRVTQQINEVFGAST